MNCTQCNTLIPTKQSQIIKHRPFFPKISQSVNSGPPTLILRTTAPLH
ncbi:hypothetical protein CFP56_020299 [Quercus suber]|uniref:Uncharacterized protein n=1 Tax=Quercus suber TaxID=58331 RepID=A0AAW0KGR5_QUESU